MANYLVELNPIKAKRQRCKTSYC